MRCIQVSLGQRTELVVCEQCPMLKKWMGEPLEPLVASVASSSIVCKSCLTTMEAVQTGGMLGCPDCYEAFADLICAQLQKLAAATPVHCGRGSPSSWRAGSMVRLQALNAQLQEALAREEYETAAGLRDQIRSLLNPNPEPQDPSPQGAADGS